MMTTPICRTASAAKRRQFAAFDKGRSLPPAP